MATTMAATMRNFLYEFPFINNIATVRAAIRGCSSFREASDPATGSTTITYKILDTDVFSHFDPRIQAVRRECRGITFDTQTGVILRRPFHKFFNLNEREETTGIIDFADFTFLEKLDGSMISPFISPVDGGVVWATKAGRTDISAMVASFVTKEPLARYEEFARTCLKIGITPIFEWCSPSCQIVIPYEKDDLILTGVREMFTGIYLDYAQMLRVAVDYNVPVVQQYTWLHSLPDLHVMKDREGYVIRHRRGHMLKVKTPWYLGLHRLLSSSMDPRILFGALLSDATDDILSQFDGERREMIETFFSSMRSALSTAATHLESISELARDRFTRAGFAASDDFEKPWKALIFRIWDGRQTGKEVVVRAARQASTSRKAVRAFCEDILGGIEVPRLMFTDTSNDDEGGDEQA